MSGPSLRTFTILLATTCPFLEASREASDPHTPERSIQPLLRNFASSSSFSSSQSWSPGKDGKLHSTVASSREESHDDGSQVRHSLATLSCADGHCKRQTRHYKEPASKRKLLKPKATLPSSTIDNLFNHSFALPHIPDPFRDIDSPSPFTMPSMLPDSFMAQDRGLLDNIAQSGKRSEDLFGQDFFGHDFFGKEGSQSHGAASSDRSSKSQPLSGASHSLLHNTAQASKHSQDLFGQDFFGRDFFGDEGSQSHDAASSDRSSKSKNLPVSSHSQSYSSSSFYSNVNGKEEMKQREEHCRDGRCKSILHHSHKDPRKKGAAKL